MKTLGIFLLLLLLTSVGSGAATFGVTTPGQQTLTNKFLPYAGSGTQLIGNSPAWRDSAGVLGINNYLEGLETLTPGAAVNLNFSTWRTKRITLNQNTVFTAINIPSASTNVQTMLLEVIGDGAFTVSFANVTWQTPEITTPEAGVVTLYALRGDNGAVKGYTQAVTATGIGPLTVGYVPLASATNNLTDSILQQPNSTNLLETGSLILTNGVYHTYTDGTAANPAYGLGVTFGAGWGLFRDVNGEPSISSSAVPRARFSADSLRIPGGNAFIWSVGDTETTPIRLGIYSGNGSPEGVQTANPGSLYLDYTNGDIYKKSSGVLDTGWIELEVTGGGPITGTVVNTGASVPGNVPYYSDTTGTNVAPSGAFLLTASTNASVRGVLSGHSAVFTNTVSAGGINLTGIESFGIACSDETTPLTTGTAKVTFRMPYAFTVTAVRASLTTAQASGNIFTVDINEGASSILSTKITIDNTETTSTTAVTAPVISDSALADDASITIDIDQIGNGSATGLKVWIIGHQ